MSELNIDLKELGKNLILKGEKMSCETFAAFEDCHDDNYFQQLIKQDKRADQMVEVGSKLLGIE